MAKEPEIVDDINEAREDLREALHEINDRVEERVAKLRPDRGIRKHPATSACIAGALGFALGAKTAETAIVGFLLLGAALMLTRSEAEQYREDQRE